LEAKKASKKKTVKKPVVKKPAPIPAPPAPATPPAAPSNPCMVKNVDHHKQIAEKCKQMGTCPVNISPKEHMAMAHRAMGLPAPSSESKEPEKKETKPAEKPAEKKATGVHAQLSSWEENALF